MAEWFALILLESIQYILKVWKSTPYHSMIDDKFDVKVVKKSKFDYFHQAGPRNGVIISFDTFIIYSIYSKRGRLKIDTILFEDWRKIWRQSCRKLQIWPFSPISSFIEIANFYTRPCWKIAEFFALILLESIPYTLKGVGSFENRHSTILGSTSNLKSKS